MGLLRKLFGKEEKMPVHKRKDEPDVYDVRDSEDSMNFAMEKARLTLDYFKQSLSSPGPHQQYFSLKAKFEENGQAEHIWLTDVSYDESSNFFGHIGNVPINVTNVKEGQKVGVPFENVSDWMILENGKLIGGYTIRAIRDTMSDKERIAFDRSMNMVIDEGADYFRHDLTTPEGAILCLEDAYDAKDIDKAISCKDFNEEAKLMLTKMKHLEVATEMDSIVTSMAEVLQLSFIKNISENFPNFIGITRAFPKREFVREDLMIVTEVCFYPDNTKSAQRLYVSRKNGEWKVLSLAD
ncbi:hypothetical protein WSM22_31810 [Cytophagales bacterium WSM2-2]|nr:hypothetical protein WSM22_31810 [Cytophagales bacterium WSM2-2]